MTSRHLGAGTRQRPRRRAMILAIAFAAIPLVLMLSCYPGEITNIEELDTVGTIYDPKVQYSQFHNYAMADSVAVIDNRTPPASHSIPQNLLDEMLQTVESNLNNLGYTRVTSVAAADVGITVGIVLSEDFVVSSYWPWGCGGYYYPGWPCYGYYPPVGQVYSYETGTVLIDMLEFNTASPDTAAVVWQAGINGLTSSTTSVNVSRVQKGINQAFEQSPYLRSAGTGGP